MMTNTSFHFKLILSSLIISMWLISGAANCFAGQDKPNILWIVSEDNSTLLGCYGDDYATTPNLDKFAKEGILYENAFAQPACALSRSTLITGVLGSSLGTEQMRSKYPIPASIRFFPEFLREAGYYTTNNDKEDYNTGRRRNAWDESSKKAHYKNRKPGQPFFAVFNLGVTHESGIGVHRSPGKLIHDPEKAPIPSYLPATPEMKHDFALYYDKVQAMDLQVAKLLKELEELGLAENTIVFYYSDNGGVLGRSKRFMYDSGLHVPLIIRFPGKYTSLASGKAGSRLNRMVSFEDFAPSVLTLAGIPIPDYMQGRSFLGTQQSSEKEYAYGFRGRIDENLEMIRSIRSKRYRYIRNYMPHKVYGQHSEYYWETPSIVSWENAFKAGQLNPVQSAFWNVKPSEELYDTEADPENVKNLVSNVKFKAVLEKMRIDYKRLVLEKQDAGFIPESMRVDISAKSTTYEFARSNQYPLERILETAEMSTIRDARKLPEMIIRLSDPNPIIRYWAATGCAVLGKLAGKADSKLKVLLSDPVPAVRIAAAEAIYGLEGSSQVLPVLTQLLKSDNQYIRVEALTVLELMQQDAKAALPEIKKMIEFRDDSKSPEQALWQFEHDIKIAKRISSNLN